MNVANNILMAKSEIANSKLYKCNLAFISAGIITTSMEQKLTVAQLFRKPQSLYGTKGSLLCSLAPVTGPYHEPSASSKHILSP
jgi:hypothetical protein